MKKILVIGRHPEILSRVCDLLKQNGYDVYGETTNEKAAETFRTNKFDAVVIGGGVDLESRNYFHVEFPKTNPAVIIIDAHPNTILSELEARLRKS